jgi:hypothetical protein
VAVFFCFRFSGVFLRLKPPLGLVSGAVVRERHLPFGVIAPGLLVVDGCLFPVLIDALLLLLLLLLGLGLLGLFVLLLAS